MTLSVLLAGGGTGGHIFPLLAVAEALRAERDDVDVTFVGTARGMEATLLPARGEKLELLDALPLKGGSLRDTARGIAKAVTGIPSARSLVRRLSPDVCLSTGGYAAGTVSLAARTLGVPVALLEPNAVLGLANRLLSPAVSRAYVVFPETANRFRPSVVRQLGMPIRTVFQPVAYTPSQDSPRLVILGGSQGAQHLNQNLPAAIAPLFEVIPGLRVLHQAGKNKDDEVRAKYAQLAPKHTANIDVVAFVDDVASTLASADLVVARAGAGSVAEICTVGRAALFVPFPYAAEDHQRHNAESLEKVGAAVCLPQVRATSERLSSELGGLLRDPARRVSLAEAARARGSAGSATAIARDLLELVDLTKKAPLLAVG